MNYVFQFRDVLRYWPFFVDGAMRTVWLSSVAIVFGLMIGIVGAIARNSRSRVANSIFAVYVEIFRNTPMLVQLFIIYFALPSIGVRFSPIHAAIIGLVLNNGAYTTEIVRAGIQSIHKSQTEAGFALGLNRFEIYRYVILPPAIANVYPALTSEFILLMLGTSIVSVVGADELTSLTNLVQSLTFRSFESYIIAALIYVVLTIAFRVVFMVVELVAFPLRRRALRDQLGLGR